MYHPSMPVTLAVIFRRIAQAGSIVSILILGMFVFGGQEQAKFLSVNEILGFALFPVGVVVGFLIAWKWELVGGLVSLLSLAGFYLWHFSNSGNLPAGPWFMIFSSPAIFFLLARCCRQTSQVEGSGP